MYKIILADGTEVKFDGMNGNNYITKEELDASIFSDENLKKGQITDEDGNLIDFENWSLIEHRQWFDGTWFTCFRQKSDQELVDEKLEDTETTLEEAVVELYEMLLED